MECKLHPKTIELPLNKTLNQYSKTKEFIHCDLWTSSNYLWTWKHISCYLPAHQKTAGIPPKVCAMVSQVSFQHSALHRFPYVKSSFLCQHTHQKAAPSQFPSLLGTLQLQCLQHLVCLFISLLKLLSLPWYIFNRSCKPAFSPHFVWL